MGSHSSSVLCAGLSARGGGREGACNENCCFYDTECELSESHTQLLCRYLNADGTVTETKPFTVTGAITGTFSFFVDIFQCEQKIVGWVWCDNL